MQLHFPRNVRTIMFSERSSDLFCEDVPFFKSSPLSLGRRMTKLYAGVLAT